MCTRLFLLCQIQRFMCNYKSFNIEVLKDQKLFELYLPLWQHSTFCNYIKLLNQSVYKPQIRTSPRVAQQGRVKCKWHITVPMVPSQEAFQRKGKNTILAPYVVYGTILYMKQVVRLCSCLFKTDKVTLNNFVECRINEQSGFFCWGLATL